MIAPRRLKTRRVVPRQSDLPPSIPARDSVQAALVLAMSATEARTRKVITLAVREAHPDVDELAGHFSWLEAKGRAQRVGPTLWKLTDDGARVQAVLRGESAPERKPRGNGSARAAAAAVRAADQAAASGVFSVGGLAVADVSIPCIPSGWPTVLALVGLFVALGLWLWELMGRGMWAKRPRVGIPDGGFVAAARAQRAETAQAPVRTMPDDLPLAPMRALRDALDASVWPDVVAVTRPEARRTLEYVELLESELSRAGLLAETWRQWTARVEGRAP